MNGQKVYITIEDPQSLMDILTEGSRKGLIKKTIIIDPNKIAYPIKIPIELSSIMKLMGNPITKKVLGSKIDVVVNFCLQRIITTEAG